MIKWTQQFQTEAGENTNADWQTRRQTGSRRISGEIKPATHTRTKYSSHHGDDYRTTVFKTGLSVRRTAQQHLNIQAPQRLPSDNLSLLKDAPPSNVGCCHTDVPLHHLHGGDRRVTSSSWRTTSCVVLGVSVYWHVVDRVIINTLYQ